MGQGQRRQLLDIVGQDIVAAVEDGPRLARLVERQTAARAGAKQQVGLRARRIDQAHDVVAHRVIDVDIPNLPREIGRICAVHHRRQRLNRVLLPQIDQHPALGLGVEIAELELEQETVELSFGQRESTLVLDRVLRSQDNERPVQWPGHAVHGDLSLAHALQQGRLRARRSAIDLIGQQDIGERRARDEIEAPRLLIVDRHARHVVGQQIGGALQTLERHAQRDRQRTGEHRLARSRHVLDQHVAFAQQGGQQQLDGIPLADDDLLDVGDDLLGERFDGVQRTALSR
jgi:hypothetical protein